MNTREAFRLADPARRLPSHHVTTADEELLQQILTTQHVPIDGVAPSRQRIRRDWRPALVTAVVAVALTIGTIAVIRTTSGSTPSPAAPSTTPQNIQATLQADVNARLRTANNGQTIDPDLPSMIWTATHPGGQGDMIDLTGKTLYTAAACNGGGAIAIRISNHPDTRIDCTSPTAVGPINLTKLLANEKNGVSFEVVVTAGHPNYFVKQIALTAPAQTTPANN